MELEMVNLAPHHQFSETRDYHLAKKQKAKKNKKVPKFANSKCSNWSVYPTAVPKILRFSFYD